MGANFINSCLETIADHMIQQAREREISDRLEIIMSILSNYTPECRVICQVSCDIDQLDFSERGMKATEFVHRFEMAVEMATHDIYRAVTHNKGIYNGIDAVILATGNDFRAVEASGHAWASRSGRYSSLSSVNLHGNQFEFIVDVPMSVGVTGGMTRLHPMARASMILLRNPGAEQLMSVAASAGLANHFSAIKALITGGIQQGHMKLHLINILNQFNADSNEKKAVLRHFQNRNVTYESVRNYLSGIRAK
jgi:hydroxymethylglutaryl-CoA reductase